RACEEAGLALSRPRAIVVAAGGASACAGESLAAICGTATHIQVTTVRGYRLPGWIGAADLVIGVSASGAGTEARALSQEAVRRGCDFAGVGPARSPLADIAAQARGVYVPVDAAGSGRSSLWALLVPLVFIASRLGVSPIADGEYEAVAEVLEEVSRQCRPTSESFVNPAKSLALDISGTVPLIWGSSPLAGVVARRFASLLAQNAKYPAVAGGFPGVAHDQVSILDGPFAPVPAPAFPSAEKLASPSAEDMGFGRADDARGAPELRLVLIADAEGEHSVHTRMREAAATVAEERGIPVSSLSLEGEGPLRRLASVTQLLDYASAYLGLASGLDPLASAARGDLRNLAQQAE
ncbi:MAG: mannose-6-phosphate isomerase, partial [Nocardiopsaceae bacterium]|nr:mannose-6-phosphate isomerase [Nocardiopsaceae bacterium]